MQKKAHQSTTELRILISLILDEGEATNCHQLYPIKETKNLAQENNVP